MRDRRTTEERNVFAQTIEQGDYLIPHPTWNRTTSAKRDKLPMACRVVRVTKPSFCETGVMVQVRTQSGYLKELSAAWFIAKTQTPPAQLQAGLDNLAVPPHP